MRPGSSMPLPQALAAPSPSPSVAGGVIRGRASGRAALPARERGVWPAVAGDRGWHLPEQDLAQVVGRGGRGDAVRCRAGGPPARGLRRPAFLRPEFRRARADLCPGRARERAAPLHRPRPVRELRSHLADAALPPSGRAADLGRAARRRRVARPRLGAASAVAADRPRRPRGSCGFRFRRRRRPRCPRGRRTVDAALVARRRLLHPPRRARQPTRKGCCGQPAAVRASSSSSSTHGRSGAISSTPTPRRRASPSSSLRIRSAS